MTRGAGCVAREGRGRDAEARAARDGIAPVGAAGLYSGDLRALSLADSVPMPRSAAPLVLALLLAACTDAPVPPAPAEAPAATPDAATAVAYDSLLAADLGADDYGMRTYVLALLKAGPNRGQDSAEAAALQRAHLANIQRMAEAGQLVLAGPFLDEGPVRGLYVFDVETVEEARRLTETDPAVQAGRLMMELRPWYGSAALRQVNDVHGRIARETP